MTRMPVRGGAFGAYGILTVHVVGMPPGTGDLLIKFVPPETLERFGGPDRFAAAIDASLTKLAGLLGEPPRIRALWLDAE